MSFWPQVPGNFNQLQPNTATFADDNLYSNCDLAWYVAATRAGLWTWIDCGRLGYKKPCWFWCWKNTLVSFNQSNNSGTIDKKKDLLYEVSFSRGALSVGVHQVCTYAYFYWHAHDFGHAFVHMYAQFLQRIF